MTKDMTKGSPLRLILGFAFPMLLGMLFQQFYNLVDTMIVGKTLGVSALAGVGATSSINFMVFVWVYAVVLLFRLHSSLVQGNTVNLENMYLMGMYAVQYLLLL